MFMSELDAGLLYSCSSVVNGRQKTDEKGLTP